MNNLFATINSRCSVKIQSVYNDFVAAISCLIVPKITSNLPAVNINLTNNSHCFLINQELNDELKQFWSIEEAKFAEPLSEDDLITNDGQFVVRIPLRFPISELGDSKAGALNRFHNLEQRFQKGELYKEQYVQFLEEYEQLNHTLITKVRVLFDGSSPTSSGESLNNIQYIGPPIQNIIFDILLRFRQHNIVVTSGIEKMYRCALVHPDYRCLQQIIWRSNPDEDIYINSANFRLRKWLSNNSTVLDRLKDDSVMCCDSDNLNVFSFKSNEAVKTLGI
nr:unnamed protein product [Callosobruchus analis]